MIFAAWPRPNGWPRGRLPGVPDDHTPASLSSGDRDPELAEALEQGLDEHNFAATGTTKEDQGSLSVKVVDADGRIVGGLTGWTWAGPRLGEARSGPRLELLRPDHAPALLAFERENRAYFAASIPDRGDEFFAEFDARFERWLEWQAVGTDYFHVLMTDGGDLVGRVNLIEVEDGSAELGYRIAEKCAGRGLATTAVREVLEAADRTYGLAIVRAKVTLDNPASRTVLERNGFVAAGEVTIDGRAAMSYIRELGVL